MRNARFDDQEIAKMRAYWFAGLPLKEIARRLGRHVNTVKVKAESLGWPTISTVRVEIASRIDQEYVTIHGSKET